MNHADNITHAFQIADEVGFPLCWCCLGEDMTQAGTLDRPDRQVHELLPEQVALVELLLNDLGVYGELVAGHKVEPAVAALHLVAFAKLVVAVMPAVVEDHYGRFGVRLNDNARIPCIDAYEWAVTAAVEALRGYLKDHDRGEWVDPYAMAGAVADVHDALRDLVVLHDLTPALVDGAQ